MLTFSQFLTEKMTAAGRWKQKRTATKNRWKLKRRAAITQDITGSTRRMKRRTQMAIRRAIYKKLLGMSPTKKTALTSTQKLEAERMVKRLGPSYVKSNKAKTLQKLSIAQRKRFTPQRKR